MSEATIRPRANQRDCLIGPNRKARKAFVLWLTNPPLRIFPIANDPIWLKRLRREARHSESAFRLAESIQKHLSGCYQSERIAKGV